MHNRIIVLYNSNNHLTDAEVNEDELFEMMQGNGSGCAARTIESASLWISSRNAAARSRSFADISGTNGEIATFDPDKINAYFTGKFEEFKDEAYAMTFLKFISSFDTYRLRMSIEETGDVYIYTPNTGIVTLDYFLREIYGNYLNGKGMAEWNFSSAWDYHM